MVRFPCRLKSLRVAHWSVDPARGAGGGSLVKVVIPSLSRRPGTENSFNLLLENLMRLAILHYLAKLFRIQFKVGGLPYGSEPPYQSRPGELSQSAQPKL